MYLSIILWSQFTDDFNYLAFFFFFMYQSSLKNKDSFTYVGFILNPIIRSRSSRQNFKIFSNGKRHLKS